MITAQKRTSWVSNFHAMQNLLAWQNRVRAAGGMGTMQPSASVWPPLVPLWPLLMGTWGSVVAQAVLSMSGERRVDW